MTASLATTITKAASSQTFYTIRFLVDRRRVEDAYRAYAYFRWLDDLLDADLPADAQVAAVESEHRRGVLARQQELLERGLDGREPRDVDAHERLLLSLVRRARTDDRGLDAYLRNMMRLMAFDAERRGGLISDAELSQYTRWLAVAVTEAMHHFIGPRRSDPLDLARYRAA